MSELKLDLVILVPDANMGAGLRGLLSRPASLAIRPISFDIRTFQERDPGCLHRSHDFLRPFVEQYEHALVLFDREGCGRDTMSRENLETEVQQRLAQSGWGHRAETIVLDPELESWVWSDSPHVAWALGWASRQPSLRAWLGSRGLWPEDDEKPPRPKEAVVAALREVRLPRSSAIYRKLAETVSFRRCTDPAFDKLRRVLVEWFPAQS